MLIVPASKVSVPLTVVILTRSSVPERFFEPPPKFVNPVNETPLPIMCDDTHVLEVILLITKFPEKEYGAESQKITYPAVELEPLLPVVAMINEEDVYPVF